MDKKFEEIEKMIDEIMNDFIKKDKKESKDKKTILKETKKIIENIDEEHESIILVTPNEAYIRGKKIEIEALFYCIVKQLLENDYTVEDLTSSFIKGVATHGLNLKKVDKDILMRVLKEIDSMI